MSKMSEVYGEVWTKVHEIDELVWRVRGVANVLEIMAVAEPSEPESGALWLMRDNLNELTDKIEGHTQNLLDLRNKALEKGTLKPKKGKKK